MKHPTLESDKPVAIRPGDITHWAARTAHFNRPKVKGRRLTFSPPVTDLAKVKPVAPVNYPVAKPEPGFCMPAAETVRRTPSTRTPAEIAKEMDQIFAS